MSAVLLFVGVWLLVSLPFGMFFGWMCSLNGPDADELPIKGEPLISDGQPIATAPATDLSPFGPVGIPA